MAGRTLSFLRLKFLSPGRRKFIYFLFTLGLLGGSIGVAWFWFNRSSQSQTPFSPAHTRLTITTPHVVSAGEEIPVLITAPALPDGTPVVLVAIGSYGPHPQTSQLQHGIATFYLPASDTRTAGLLTLVASAGQAQAETQLLIQPGSPADPILTVVGPRSIMAGGQDKTMIVAVPMDAFGNPVAPQTPVEIEVDRPETKLNAQNLKLEAKTRYLLVWARLPSGTSVGQTRLAVNAGLAHSIEETILETPGRPISFTLSARPTTLPADGRQLVELATSPIADAYGNLLPEGSTITFLITGPGAERRTIPAATIFDGRAQAVLQAPLRPGVMTVQAVVAGVLSRPLRLTFTPGVALANKAMPVSAELSPDKLALHLGPLTGSLGQFIPDGTPVEVEVFGPDNFQWQAAVPADAGYLVAEMRQAVLPSGLYLVTVTLGNGQAEATFMVP